MAHKGHCSLFTLWIHCNVLIPLINRAHAGEIVGLQFGSIDGPFVPIKSPQVPAGTVSVPTYSRATLSVMDHSILVKDQDAFDETSVFIENNRVIFGPGLVATVGEQHKRQRKAVKPVFSVMQLKKLTPIFYELAEKVCIHTIRATNQGGSSRGAIINGDPYSNADSGRVDMSEWMSRIALETVGQAVLGYSFDPLDSQQINPYTAAVKELIPTLFRLSIVRQFVPWLARIGSPALRRKLVELVPHEAVQKVKNSSDVCIRQRGASSNQSARESRNKQTKTWIHQTGYHHRIAYHLLSTFPRLYMLSVHPNWQDNLREEIFEALDNSDANGRLSYEDIMTLPLLDACHQGEDDPICYTNRGYGFHHIPVGTTLFLGIASANRLESVWGVRLLFKEDAKEWNPERWIVMGAAEAVDSSSAKNAKLPEIILVKLLSRFTFAKTGDTIVWNLSQIISPSTVTRSLGDGGVEVEEEKKGLPLLVRAYDSTPSL
ncbi:cytochrome P450-dit [Salix suchowensis]|nr:cytochrome P450-dit [Salix suchowensis]